MAFWSALAGVRWVSIALTVAKWGSIVAVVGYLGWNVLSNYQLREELAVIENEIGRMEAANLELRRRVGITERELESLQQSRLESRRQMEETLALLEELNLDPETTSREEVEKTVNDLWKKWMDDAENLSRNNN